MNPRAICRQAPGIVSAAVPADDFDGCAARIDLPCPLVTEATPLPAVTVDALRPTFDNLARGVTDPERVARTAQVALPVRIEGRHCTRRMAGTVHAPDAGLTLTITDRRARVLRAAGGSIAADDEG